MKKVKPSKKKSNKSVKNNKPRKETRLEMALRYSLNQVKNDGSTLDKIFLDQASRLRLEIGSKQ